MITSKCSKDSKMWDAVWNVVTRDIWHWLSSFRVASAVGSPRLTLIPSHCFMDRPRKWNKPISPFLVTSDLKKLILLLVYECPLNNLCFLLAFLWLWKYCYRWCNKFTSFTEKINMMSDHGTLLGSVKNLELQAVTTVERSKYSHTSILHVKNL